MAPAAPFRLIGSVECFSGVIVFGFCLPPPHTFKEESTQGAPPIFLDGVYLSFSQRNGEYVFGLEEGIVGARTIKRNTLDHRLDNKLTDNNKGGPLDFKGGV